MSAHRTRTTAFTLNGVEVSETAPANAMAADILRDRHALTGLKIGCDQAVCGACTILVDGAPAASCATLAFTLDGKDVRTIEGLAAVGGKSAGLADGDALHPVQQAFKNNSAFQCGYCTPGMILLAVALLERNADPSRAEITEWMSANVCRCTGYQMIVEAVEAAASAMAEAAA